jgi:tetraacyldisaccharide 4'-kinase
VEWVQLGGGTESPEALRSKQALAFCGVGNPESFRRQVLSLGLRIAELLCFRDHHQYTPEDLERIDARAVQVGAEEVVMTQKDAVKIEAAEGRARWKYLRIRQEVSEGAEEYLKALSRLKRKS